MATTPLTIDPRPADAVAQREALLRVLIRVLAAGRERSLADAVALIGAAPGVCDVVLEVAAEWEGAPGRVLTHPVAHDRRPAAARGAPPRRRGRLGDPPALRFELGEERALGTFTVTWDGPSPPLEAVEWCRAVSDLLCGAVARARLEAVVLHGQRFELAGQIGAGLVHDFNNLLTGIIGYASIARGRLTPDHPAVAALRSLEDVATTGGALARALIDFVRGTDDGSGRLDVNAAVRATHGLVSRAIRDAVDLRLDLAADIPPIEGSVTLIQQALLNLVVNAADAIDGAGEIVISTRLVRELPTGAVGVPETAEAYVAIAVADDGPGVAPEIAARVFEPFFTTKGARGTGLGLTAVARAARWHGGSVHLAPEAGASEVGHGATFTIFLPVRDASTAHARSGPTARGRVAR